MATQAQLEEGIRRADAAGDTEAVKALGAELLRIRGTQPAAPPPAPQAQAPRSIDTAAMQAEYQKAIGQGMDANQIGEWLKSNDQQFDPAQVAAAVEFRRKNPNVPLDKYALNVTTPGFLEGLPKAAEDFATNVTSGFYSGIDFLSNMNPLHQVAKMAGGLAGFDVPDQNIAGYINSINPNAQNNPDAGLQQFFGAALLPGPKGASAPKYGFNALARAEQATTAPAQNALASAATKDVGLIPNAEKVVAAGIDHKVPVFRTDIMPPQTRFGQGMRMVGENIWLAGTGGKRAAQQKARVAAVERIASEYGANDLSNIGETAQNAINAVTKAFSERRAKELDALTATKRNILEGIAGEVPPTNTIAAIDRQIAELSSIGTDAASAVIRKLEDWKQALTIPATATDTGILDASGKAIIRRTPEQGKQLKVIEKIRKEMGDAFAGQNMADIRSTGEAALSKIYGPMREDMTAFIRANAGEGVATRFTNANDRLAAMAGELADAKFKRVLKTADATPENIAKLLFSKTPSDVIRLVANLDDAGRAKAEAAIILKAVEGSTKDGVVSPQQFATAIQSMRNATRLMAGSEKAAQIEGLSRLLKATQHASEAAAFPITGAQLTPMAATGGLVTVLGQLGLGNATIPTAALAGIFARLYENKIPAQLLGQLGKVKPGSKAETAIAARLAPHIAKLLPAAANDAGPMPMSPGAAAAQGNEPQN